MALNTPYIDWRPYKCVCVGGGLCAVGRERVCVWCIEYVCGMNMCVCVCLSLVSRTDANELHTPQNPESQVDCVLLIVRPHQRFAVSTALSSEQVLVSCLLR